MYKFQLSVFMIITYAVFCITLAFVSITITGFKFGTGNNVFHIPYVLNLAESQEFTDDAFYSSLKHYTSIIWPILRLVSNETNIENVFYIANLLSRAAAFAGIVFLMRGNGLKSILSMAICMIVIALTPWLQGYSIVGGHGMFIDYFSHTEIAWALVFLSLGLFSQYRLTSASALTGAIFSINAFVGMWLFLANNFSLLYSRKRIDSATAIKSIGVALLFASPTAAWIIFAIDGGGSATHFSYLNYIRQYYPDHFLIEATSWRALAIFALVSVNGVIAAQYMLNKSYWVGVQLGFILILLVGIPLPYLLDNRFVINLHLLRSAGVEQAIAVILSGIAGTKLIMSAESSRNQLLGVIVLVSVSTFDRSISSISVIALALFVGFFYSQDFAFNNQSILSRLAERHATVLVLFWLTIVCFLLALVRHLILQQIGLTQSFLLIFIVSALSIFLYQGLSAITKLKLFVLVLVLYSIGIMAKNTHWRAEDTNIRQEVASANDSWIELVDWIRSSSVHGIFLVPVKDEHSDGFQLHARRKVWVDWKQGAAVMWSPSFHEQWMRRFKEVSALKTPDDFILYARNHGINNILLKSDTGVCPAPSRLVKPTDHYVLCGI